MRFFAEFTLSEANGLRMTLCVRLPRGYALATTFGRIATPGCRNACLHKAFRRKQALRRAGTLPLVARNDVLAICHYEE